MRNVQFKSIDGEPWVCYQFEDGTVLKVKVVVTGVIEHPTGPDFLPQYEIKAQHICSIEHPTEVLKTASDRRAAMATGNETGRLS